GAGEEGRAAGDHGTVEPAPRLRGGGVDRGTVQRESGTARGDGERTVAAYGRGGEGGG
ncbi:hypothetical protein THAOC_26865, partial [Thalassiosira oceanica]